MSYTYYIEWSKENKKYYGVKYSSNSDPKDFWKKYFTSSTKVEKMRKEFGDPNIIQIRKVFEDPEKAIIWEHKVLRRLNVGKKIEWLNMTSQPGIPIMLGEDNPMMKKVNRNRHLKAVRSAEYRERMRQIVTGRTHSNETRLKQSKSAKKAGTGLWMAGLKKTKEWKEYMTEVAKKRPKIDCEKCGRGITKQNYEKHLIACK